MRTPGDKESAKLLSLPSSVSHSKVCFTRVSCPSKSLVAVGVSPTLTEREGWTAGDEPLDHTDRLRDEAEAEKVRAFRVRTAKVVRCGQGRD